MSIKISKFLLRKLAFGNAYLCSFKLPLVNTIISSRYTIAVKGHFWFGNRFFLLLRRSFQPANIHFSNRFQYQSHAPRFSKVSSMRGIGNATFLASSVIQHHMSCPWSSSMHYTSHWLGIACIDIILHQDCSEAISVLVDCLSFLNETNRGDFLIAFDESRVTSLLPSLISLAVEKILPLDS
ncbi:hypothetical protein Pelo_13630 [Pelomyxa schiedti]|nr:hypothetical protein Pelo_13630 [Pelomyxa schiedti]